MANWKNLINKLKSSNKGVSNATKTKANTKANTKTINRQGWVSGESAETRKKNFEKTKKIAEAKTSAEQDIFYSNKNQDARNTAFGAMAKEAGLLALSRRENKAAKSTVVNDLLNAAKSGNTASRNKLKNKIGR